MQETKKMGLTQIDIIEFYCKTSKDTKKIESILKAISKLQKENFGEVRG